MKVVREAGLQPSADVYVDIRVDVTVQTAPEEALSREKKRWAVPGSNWGPPACKAGVIQEPPLILRDLATSEATKQVVFGLRLTPT